MALSNTGSTCTEMVSSTVFPFMSLPLEIRIMIYDAIIPATIRRSVADIEGISPCIQAFMMMKVTRNEFLGRLFSDCHFVWTGANSQHEYDDSRDSFRRYAVPFIRTLTIHLENPWLFSKPKSSLPPQRFDVLLK